MKIHVKQTIWEEIEILIEPEQDSKEWVHALKNGQIQTIEDVFTFKNNMNFHSKFLLETAEQMTFEENDNQPTFEAFDSNDNKITDNAK